MLADRLAKNMAMSQKSANSNNSVMTDKSGIISTTSINSSSTIKIQQQNLPHAHHASHANALSKPPSYKLYSNHEISDVLEVLKNDSNKTQFYNNLLEIIAGTSSLSKNQVFEV